MSYYTGGIKFHATWHGGASKGRPNMQFLGFHDALAGDDLIGSLGLSQKQHAIIQWKACKEFMSNARN
jgi:hypothetical protein